MEQQFEANIIHTDKDKDPSAQIILLTKGHKIVGSARVRFLDEYAKFELIVVSEKERGNGLGDILLAEMEQRVRAKKYTLCKLTGQARLSSYYEKNGFHKTGDMFKIGGVAHYWFEKNLL